MATSSKTQFKLEDLQRLAVQAIDEQISQQEQVVASYDDQAALEQRMQDWRTSQEERVSHLFSRLGGSDLSNEELASFKIAQMPLVDRWDRIRAESDLRALKNKRSKIIAKSSALAADTDGNIHLTATQLREFFGL
jgi:hypothetical protein